MEEEVDVALSRRAASEGTTKAELIRAALRDAAKPALRVKPPRRSTSAIVAFMNAGDLHHGAVRAWVEARDDPVATTPMIVG